MPNSVFLTDGVPFSGQMVGPAADNTAAPPFTFLGDLTSGYASSATGVLDLVSGGTSRARITTSALILPSGNALEWGSSALATPDLFLLRAGANSLKQQNSSNVQAFSVGALNPPTTSTLDQIFAGAGFYAGQEGAGGEFDFGWNAYYNSGWKYRIADAACSLTFNGVSSNTFDLRIAGSGSADAAITWTRVLSGTISALTFRQPTFYTNALADGQVLNFVQTLTELTTIAAAATTDTTIQMPAASVVLGVSVRVTTVIPTATSFSVGDSGSAARFSTANVSSAANSTDPGTKAGAYYNASALSVRLTMNGGTPAANSGRVRVTIYYYTVTPPTS